MNGLRRDAPKGYYTHVVTDYALDWLRQCERDRPWVLCLGHKAPHSFYFPEEKYAHVFDDVRVPYPDTAFALDGKPAWIRQRLRTWHGIYGPLFDWRKNFPDDRPEAVKDFENMVHAYWGTVLSVDDSVGRLVAYLRENGQLENTIVVFMGDNGLLEGEHGMVDKRTMHEPSIRIPLIVSGPYHPAGRTVTQQVLTVDIAPSLLDVCGAPPLADIQGRSWKKLVDAGDPDWRTAWFYEYNYERQFPYTPNVRGIRADEWKYIRYPTGDSTPDKHLPELYHLSDDPEERHNLVADPKFASTRRQMETRLADLLAATGLANGQDTMPIDEGVKTELPNPKIR